MRAHPSDIFSLAPTSTQILTASGSPDLQVYTLNAENGLVLAQSIVNAHRAGCHHLTTSGDCKTAASAGFGGEVTLWKKDNDADNWKEHRKITGTSMLV